jgi:hypothetical protein
MAGLNFISPFSQSRSGAFDGLLVFGDFAVRQLGRSKASTAVAAESCDPNWTSNTARICIDHMLNGPSRQEDRFSEARPSVRAKDVD